MTRVITFANAKGGAGKTTLALAFAVMAEQQGKRCLMIDTDQQATLSTLFGMREDKGQNECMNVAPAHLERRLRTEAGGDDAPELIVIDTPGRLDDCGPAIRAADLVVVPVQCSGPDFYAFKRIFDVCMKWERDVLVVPNRIKTRQELETFNPTIIALTENRASLAAPVWDRVGHRRDSVDGLTIVDAERPGMRGYDEVKALAEQIEELTNGA